MCLMSSCSFLWPVHWIQVLSRGWQALLQLHLSDQQFYCILRCDLYKRFGSVLLQIMTSFHLYLKKRMFLCTLSTSIDFINRLIHWIENTCGCNSTNIGQLISNESNRCGLYRCIAFGFEHKSSRVMRSAGILDFRKRHYIAFCKIQTLQKNHKFALE